MVGIFPTVSQPIRISRVTCVWLICCASHAVRSSKSRVYREPALAHGSVDKIIAMLDKHPRGATVAIVGHEPELSAVLGRLLGAPHAEGFAFKKGGAALVDLADGPSGSGLLIWFLKPKILRTLAEG